MCGPATGPTANSCPMRDVTPLQAPLCAHNCTSAHQSSSTLHHPGHNNNFHPCPASPGPGPGMLAMQSVLGGATVAPLPHHSSPVRLSCWQMSDLTSKTGFIRASTPHTLAHYQHSGQGGAEKAFRFLKICCCSCNCSCRTLAMMMSLWNILKMHRLAFKLD